MEYIKNYESDEEQDTNIQTPTIITTEERNGTIIYTNYDPTKPCKCGSILHKRTNHKSCPLYKKKKVSNTRRNEDDEDCDEKECDYCGSPLCWCFRCDTKNICERCKGDGGDYGENEEWVCNRCLPTCLVCGKKLFCHDEECCGGGRSDGVEN